MAEMAEIKTLEAGKFLSENTVYKSGVGTVVPSTKANQAIILAYNEGIDNCILELETGENSEMISRLKKLKIISL